MMMQISDKLVQPTRVMLALGFLAAAVYGGYALLGSLDTQIRSAIIAALVAFGVAITSNLVQRKRELEFKIRERKVEAYQKIFDFTMYFLRASNSPEGLSDTKLADFFYEINYALIMWGSSDSIVKWTEFQAAAKIKMPPDERGRLLYAFGVRTKLAELVRVIRKDLGHVDQGLSLEMIADLFFPIRDKEESLERILTDKPAHPPPST